MPIDPNIALSYRPVAVPDPIEQRLRQGQLASLAGAQQLQQAQLTGANLENAQRAVQMRDQQTMRQAMIDANGDGDKMFSLATQRGVSPQSLLALKGSLLDMKTKAATLDKDTLANTQTQHDQLQSRIAPIVNEKDPVKQQAAWNAALPDAVKAGEMKPEEAAQHPYPGPDGVKSYAASLNLSKWALTQQQTATSLQRTADAAATAAKQAQTDLQNASAKLGATKSPDEYAQTLATLPYGLAKQFEGKTAEQARALGMSSEQQNTAAQAAANAAETKTRDTNTETYRNAELGQGAARLGLERQRVGLEAARQGNGGEDPLAGLSGAELQRIKLVANGDIPAPPARSPAYKQTMDAVLAMDPTYTESRYLGKKSFNTGADANNLVSITTALSHLERAKANSANLSVWTGGSALNATPNQKRYNSDVDLVTGEVGKLVKSGVVSVDESKRMISNLSSPFQSSRDAGIDELSILMNGKFEGIRQKFRNSTNQDIPLSKFDAPTQARMRALGVEGGAPAAPPAPAAAAPGAPIAASPQSPQSPQAAPKFAGRFKQTASGPGGQKIGSNDGNTWFDLTTGKKLQ
jgi:hypothetical protein